MTHQIQDDHGDALGALLHSYARARGAADELLDADAAIRPAWEPMIAHLSRTAPEKLGQDFLRGDQYLRDAGVFFRHYDEGAASERDWPLSHIPVLLDQAEFAHISASLVERADLLEWVAADLYGENSLVKVGHLPPELVAGNPEWLRPLVGVQPPSGHYLHFVAFEIGRGPDGRWWVLSDRTDTPAGAGFAIENRVATTRVFSDTGLTANILKLAPFFRAFRDHLYGLRTDSTRRIGLLSSGPKTETYFEHAYIARYLGMLLLEGEDLATEGGRLMLRTVAGLRPIEVLWRRMDAAQADPLELDAGSQQGVPGLLEAVRGGHVRTVNALGTGILQSRALLAFLPSLHRRLHGRGLSMPNVATWWCGEEAARTRVMQNARHMTVGPAHSTRLPFDPGDEAVAGATLDPATLAARLDADPGGTVAQEIVTLSTTPAFADGALVPRPMTLRVFLARTETGGWQVMPGGYARIGRTAEATAVAMQQGGRVADVWVVGDGPAPSETMLPDTGAQPARSKSGTLPSRASENLYWLGRYIERAESLIRLVRAYHTRLAEAADPGAPLLRHVATHFAAYGADSAERVPGALIETLGSAITSASRIRDRFSTDGWIVLNELHRAARNPDPALAPGDPTARLMGALLRQLAGFSGLVRENMYRFTGWRFLSMGRAVERASTMSAALAHFTGEGAPEGSFDLALELGDSAMSYRRLFSVATARDSTVHLLALDPRNPRSILYQLDEISDHVAVIGNADEGEMGPLNKAVLRLRTDLRVREAGAVDTATLLTLRDSVDALAALVSATHLR